MSTETSTANAEPKKGGNTTPSSSGTGKPVGHVRTAPFVVGGTVIAAAIAATQIAATYGPTVGLTSAGVFVLLIIAVWLVHKSRKRARRLGLGKDATGKPGAGSRIRNGIMTPFAIADLNRKKNQMLRPGPAGNRTGGGPTRTNRTTRETSSRRSGSTRGPAGAGPGRSSSLRGPGAGASPKSAGNTNRRGPASNRTGPGKGPAGTRNRTTTAAHSPAGSPAGGSKPNSKNRRNVAGSPAGRSKGPQGKPAGSPVSQHKNKAGAGSPGGGGRKAPTPSGNPFTGGKPGKPGSKNNGKPAGARNNSGGGGSRNNGGGVRSKVKAAGRGARKAGRRTAAIGGAIGGAVSTVAGRGRNSRSKNNQTETSTQNGASPSNSNSRQPVVAGRNQPQHRGGYTVRYNDGTTSPDRRSRGRKIAGWARDRWNRAGNSVGEKVRGNGSGSTRKALGKPFEGVDRSTVRQVRDGWAERLEERWQQRERTGNPRPNERVLKSAQRAAPKALPAGESEQQPELRQLLDAGDEQGTRPKAPKQAPPKRNAHPNYGRSALRPHDHISTEEDRRLPSVEYPEYPQQLEDQLSAFDDVHFEEASPEEVQAKLQNIPDELRGTARAFASLGQNAQGTAYHGVGDEYASIGQALYSVAQKAEEAPQNFQSTNRTGLEFREQYAGSPGAENWAKPS